MKKAFQRQQTAYLYEKNGKLWPEEVCIEEIVAAINRGIQGEWADSAPETLLFRKLHDWICRYMEEGPTDQFLNDINSHLRQVRYSNYVVPPDFYSPDGKSPQSVYVADMNESYSLDTLAAKELSRFITYGMLDRVRRCQHTGCENIFIGPPQSKWCSRTCGSNYRVNKKRKKDRQ